MCYTDDESFHLAENGSKQNLLSGFVSTNPQISTWADMCTRCQFPIMHLSCVHSEEKSFFLRHGDSLFVVVFQCTDTTEPPGGGWTRPQVAVKITLRTRLNRSVGGKVFQNNNLLHELTWGNCVVGLQSWRDTKTDEVFLISSLSLFTRLLSKWLWPTGVWTCGSWARTVVIIPGLTCIRQRAVRWTGG